MKILLHLLLASLAAGQSLYCDESRWLPEGTEYVGCAEGVEYDGSLIPDCKWFLNNVTSYYHIHEYGRSLTLMTILLISGPDCSKFWECSPEGVCLFQCAECGAGPQCLDPNGVMQQFTSFDCRSLP